MSIVYFLRTGSLGVLFVSISVLRVEDDASLRLLRPTFTVFQSTSSVWRTTGVAALQDVQLIISIHVLRVEDDGSSVLKPSPP